MPAISPTIPPEPADSDPPEKWVHYRWAVSENNKAAHAQAQADTAAAMLEAARVQALMIAEMGKPLPRQPLTQGDVVRLLLPHIPQRISDTEATYSSAVNALAARLLPLVNA